MIYRRLEGISESWKANIPSYADKIQLETGIYVAAGLTAVALLIILKKKRRKKR